MNGTDLRLTPSQSKALAGPALSNQFTVDERLYRDYTDFSSVYEYPDLDLRAIREMLSKDGNPRKLEQVLTLPIRGANWELRGSGPAMGLVRANLGPLLNDLIAQCTSAFSYRRAFFETVWKLDGVQVVYGSIESRPAVSCEQAFHADTGRPDGFRQQLAPIVQITDRTLASMGWVRVPRQRAFTYTYGSHREPLRGISDLDVSLYCWENIRKLQFLWFQFLEQQSLPKTLVYGDSASEAQRNARSVADAHASAVIPIERRSDPTQKTFEVLESAGHGAAGFVEAIQYLEGKQTSSVLASFTDLAQHASVGGRGSNALSADQSEFFLAATQAKADEMAQQITTNVIRPLVIYNYGPDVEVPNLHIGPIGNRQTDRALALLTTLVTAQTPNVPAEFTGQLINHVASFLGLESDKVAAIVDTWQAEKQAQAAAPPVPPGGQPPLPGTENLPAEAKLSRAIGLAHELVTRVTNGVDPDDVLRELTPKRRRRP